MTVLRRYGRGLRIVGQTLEVDFGDGPDQVPSNMPATEPAPTPPTLCPVAMLLCLRAVARSSVWTGVGQTLWSSPEDPVTERALVLRVLGRAGTAKDPLRVRLYDLTRGQYLLLGDDALELTLASTETTQVMSRHLRRDGGLAPGREALLEVQLAGGDADADAPGILERAELVVL